MYMKFNKLVKIVTEAKGTKPGERYFNSKRSLITPTCCRYVYYYRNMVDVGYVGILKNLTSFTDLTFF